MERKYNPALQFEAAWVLTIIAGGTSEHTNAVVKAGAVPRLIKLLKSGRKNVVEQSVAALGNIAADSPTLREDGKSRVSIL